MSNGPSPIEIEEAEKMKAFLTSPMATYLQDTLRLECGESTTLVLLMERHYPHALYVPIIAKAQGRIPWVYTLARIEDLRGQVEQIEKALDLSDTDPWLFLNETGGTQRYLLGRSNGVAPEQPTDNTNDQTGKKYPTDPMEKFLDKVTIVTAQPPQVFRRVTNPYITEENPDPYIFATIYPPTEMQRDVTSAQPQEQEVGTPV